MTALPLVLQPGSIQETISELNVVNTRLQDFFISGGGRRPFSGRYFSWDVFNETRNIAGGRAPGTPPARISPQPVGHVNGVFPRVHESLPLLYEQIHNLRRLGTTAELDVAGESYIVSQEMILKQRLANHIEFQFLAMCRGKYYYTQSGDDINVSLTSGAQTVDYLIPAGNRDQLDMLGAGDIINTSWNTVATADIPGDLFAIDAAFEQLVGLPLRHVWCNGTRMNTVLNNTAVKALAGTSNVVFDRFERIEGSNDFIVTLKGLPWLQWHVTNGVLAIGGTTLKLFDDDEVLFCPEPDPSWIQYYEGSEIVVEYPGATPAERFGSYYYAEPTTKPAGYELISLHNGIPALKNPNMLAFADVTP